MSATMIVNPFDLVKNRMQMSGIEGTAREYRTSFHAIRVILHNEGIRGLYAR